MINWKDIKGYEGRYQISDCGKVKSFVYYNSERILLQNLEKIGYFSVALVDENHIMKRKKVHRLVAEAFIPNPLNLPQVNHKDGNKQNNSVDNLEWCNAKENIKHSIENNLRKNNGENSWNAVLTNHQVNEIRKQKGIISYRKLANEYNVSKTTIAYAITNKTYINE